MYGGSIGIIPKEIDRWGVHGVGREKVGYDLGITSAVVITDMKDGLDVGYASLQLALDTSPGPASACGLEGLGGVAIVEEMTQCCGLGETLPGPFGHRSAKARSAAWTGARW